VWLLFIVMTVNFGGVCATASESGDPNKPNEDYVLTTPDLLVLLDGQTVRTDTGCTHGVPWYVRHLAEEISTHINAGPTGALSESIDAVARLHRETCDLTHPGTPSAAVAIVHIQNEYVHWLVLSDITLILETTGGIEVISDLRIRTTALAERAIANEMPADDPAKPAALVRMKHAELAARNTPGGFWVAAVDPSAARHAITGRLPVADLQRAAVLSDGAARIVDTFESATWLDVLNLIEFQSPMALIQAVRTLEESDPSATKWPRNKLADDASVAIAAFTRGLTS
jgi:hypothetical protein